MLTLMKIFSRAKRSRVLVMEALYNFETLEEIPENDILYMLIAVVLLLKPIDSLVNKLENGNDILVFQNKHTNRVCKKRFANCYGYEQ